MSYSDPTVITLTAIPSRFSDLGATLHSLLNQDLPADEIRLNIPLRYRRFPDWDGHLPELPNGVRIVRTDEDFGPASKVLPTVAELRGEAVDILFCDDDKVYDRSWHARFKADRAVRPAAALVAVGESLPDIGDEARSADRLPRARRRRKGPVYRLRRIATLGIHKPHLFTTSGYVDMLSGYGGVMIRPDFLDDEAFDIPKTLWTVDDPWLSGHLERMGVPIWLNHRHSLPREGRASRRDALLDLVEDGRGRNDANIAVIRHMRERYGIWLAAGRPLPPARWMHPTMRRLAHEAASLPVGVR